MTTIDVENPDDYIVLDRQRADQGTPLPPKPLTSRELREKHIQTTLQSDYVLVEQAAAMSSFEKYGAHMLLWLGFATSLWGAIFVMTLSTVWMSKKDFDATLIVCIPMLMVWALATMWTAYKNRSYCKALLLSIIPILVLTAILVWWYVPI